jgi:hypothetical protein
MARSPLASREEKSAGSKRDRAVEFIRTIRTMPRERLHDLILENTGEELAQFFLSYATELMEREPERAVENASSLLLIGYLIRCFEEDLELRAAALENPLLQ